MPFKEGKEWKGNKFGRPRGSQNRSSEMMKVNLQRAINGSLDFLASDLQEIREKDKVEAIKLVTKLLDYTLPKMKSIDMNAQVELNTKIEEITINIKRSGSNED